MGFWSRLLGRTDPQPPPGGTADEHALLITIPLASEWPTEEEMARYHALQDELGAAVQSAGAGELDGDEWGGGQCVIFLYGPDADRLFQTVAPVLEKHPFPKGAVAVKRFGGPGCGREEQVNLHWEG